jgi:hypothetical protein
MRRTADNLLSSVNWRALIVVWVLSCIGVALLAGLDAPSPTVSIALAGMAVAAALTVAPPVTRQKSAHEKAVFISHQAKDEPLDEERLFAVESYLDVKGTDVEVAVVELGRALGDVEGRLVVGLIKDESAGSLTSESSSKGAHRSETSGRRPKRT